MKKKINELLNAETSSLKINEMFTLRRTQHDAAGNRCDTLSLWFTGTPLGFAGEIKSRDAQGITAETEELITDYMTAYTNEMLRKLKGGLIGDARIQEV